MVSSYKDKDADVVATVNGKWISWAHTVLAYCAFVGALVVGLQLHYHKIVQNEFYGYPQEWFPSVSATIGDRYPERSVFQLFIALTSGPRFILVGLWYALTRRRNSALPKFVAGIGIFRSLTCGGWTYITSTDDHDWHDIFMISYLVATIPWTFGCIALSPTNPVALKYRKFFSGAFYTMILPLIYFFIQHKVHRVAGAYTTYAFFEWMLVLLDVAFDAVTVCEFQNLEITIRDTSGISCGLGHQTVSDAMLAEEKDKEVFAVLSPGFSMDELLDAAADVYNGFVFWSILTSLGVCVWYFPLWHMGISGYEVLVMTSVSPFILGIKPLRSFIVRNIRIYHLLSLSGLLSYLITNPANRLFAVGFGVSMSCLSWTATFYAERSRPPRLEARISAFALGLMASSIAKFANYTNNPIWPIVHGPNGGWNKMGISLAVIAILRSTSSTASSGADLPAPGPTKGSSVLTSFGLGGLFFAMHSLLSDSSTMILWVWEGYPVRGPIAVPHGAWTLLAMGFGLCMGLFNPTLARSWACYGVGSIGAAILTTSSHWKGYYGALALTIYTMSIAPVLLSYAARHAPARTFGLGFLIYNILVLAHVWVVAYAFVPGGPLMREHTDWVMTAMMLCIGAGVFSVSTQPIITPKDKRAVGKSRSYYLYMLGFLEILAIVIAYLRFPSYNYAPYHPETKSLTAGIWTIHFSLDNDMWSSEYRIRDLIKELEIDVIGLLESDLQRIIMGNRDTTQFLAEDLGMYVDFGPGPNKHTWGSALLSKFPIVNSTHHLLPSPVGELAPAIEATIDAYGTLIDIFVFHSGQDEDPEDRRLQSLYLAERMKATPRPAILLSYLVTKPQEGNYNTYVGEMSGMKDIDPSDWDRWCEYILYKGLKRSGYARVSRSTITDTELQVGKFVVDQPEGTDDVIPEDQVPEGLKFPVLFNGEGVRGHRYHVFDAPRYYA
ncbi:calcofluor white hypersensitive protein-like protein [Byssothecium circinans]|uniref:Calcofluor white hypersensitive protein-like protein n=1 Tax=Byssothecium circinans TaxID=147558 RepID=A0A6A5U5Z6_9PLEO|nr:calcofluor white hypersensitive protein-like protein [Byssothecium circinans]